MKLNFTESSGKHANVSKQFICLIIVIILYPTCTYILYSGNAMHALLLLSDKPDKSVTISP